MIRLTILIALLLVSSPSFSQTVTDSSSVILPEQIARQVIKDLTASDAAIQELTLVKSVLVLTEKKVFTQDSLITNLSNQIKNLQLVEVGRKEQLKLSNELSGKLEKDLQIEKTKTLFYQSSTGVMIGVAIAVGLFL